MVSRKAPKVYTCINSEGKIKKSKYGLELKDITLQCFEEVQKLQKYRLLNVPENLTQNSLKEPRGLPIFWGITRRLKKDTPLQSFEEGILRETRGLP